MKTSIMRRTVWMFVLMIAMLFALTLSAMAERIPTKASLTPYTEADFVNAPAVMKTQYPVYEKDIGRIFFTIESEQPISYGSYYTIEMLTDGAWMVVPFSGVMFEDWLLDTTGPSKTVDHIYLQYLKTDWPDGRYRIIKEISGKPCAAEFEIGRSRICAATPNGTAKLERLPKSYSVEDAKRDGVFVIGKDFSYNDEKAEQFIDSVLLRMPCMLRTARISNAGEMTIVDFVYDWISYHGPGRFEVRRDSSRVKGGKQSIDRGFYSYMSLRTIGREDRICFSNYSSYKDHAPDKSPYMMLSPQPNEISLVDRVGKSILGNRVNFRFTLFARDGKHCATISEHDGVRMGFGFAGIDVSGGSLLEYEPAFAHVQQLTGLRWLDNSRVELSGFTLNGGDYRTVYNLKTYGFETAGK